MPHDFSVFIVDDNRVTAQLLARRLQRSGLSRVHIASDADRARELRALQHGRAIWLVDCCLGDANGIELIESWQPSRHEACATALMSGTPHLGASLTDSALRGGALAVFAGQHARHQAAAWVLRLVAFASELPLPDSLASARPDARPPGAAEQQQVHALLQLCMAANPAETRRWSDMSAGVGEVARRVGLGPAQSAWLQLVVGLLALPALYAGTAAPMDAAPARRRWGARTMLKTDDALRAIPSRWARLARELLHNQDEHWDGSGGPVGRQGLQIPLSARILAIAGLLAQAPFGSGVGTLMSEAGRRIDPDLATRYALGACRKPSAAGSV